MGFAKMGVDVSRFLIFVFQFSSYVAGRYQFSYVLIISFYLWKLRVSKIELDPLRDLH
jgi:hypothetical protein